MKKIFLFTFFLSTLAYSTPKTDKHILFIGDSLTEGYEVPKEQSFPSQLEKLLKEKKNEIGTVKVTNAGVSGSTSASGLARLQWVLRSNPTHLVLALGANDGLRGIQPESTKVNLKKVINLAKKNNIKILLVGMMVPPNYGPEYSEKFKKIFAEIAKEENVSLYPFLLKDVAGEPKLNISDGIHPNGEGYQIIANNILPHIRKLLDE